MTAMPLWFNPVAFLQDRSAPAVDPTASDTASAPTFATFATFAGADWKTENSRPADLGGGLEPRGDTTDDWFRWHAARVRRWTTMPSHSIAEAAAIAWGEAENAWHRRHGATWQQSSCAGCEGLISGRACIVLADGVRVHLDDACGTDCLTADGARWRGVATAGLIALVLSPPATNA
jgi:hypothetical protein